MQSSKELNMSLIKTPDQRVRVFISSTINELADERKAARDAIEKLRLIPVFFEAGARPHPPRDLYSAYLDQSHIFLGIYWNSYGWVAPGQSISGLEDEYRLCANKKPKLIYVKKSNERQPLLENLINEIGNSDTACYQKFGDAEELGKLIENDLSVLMSEIFENALSANYTNDGIEIDKEENHRIEEIPLLKSDLIGREDDIQKISSLISKKEVSLVTILGAGGTGKTTLAVHLAHLLKDGFTQGVVFIPLAPVTDLKLVPSTIANALGLQDSGKSPIEQTLVEYLIDKNLLLILDNFEQIVEASRLISEIINHCKLVKIIVTTRTSLHLRNERIYNLSTLQLPEEGQAISANELKNYAATKLFVDRAIEVNPRIILDQENTMAIVEICRRMDGLPLAIELAAARTKFFQPAALMNRIDKALDFVSKGQRDLPERQQTLRAAIEWSYNLLTSDTQKAFRKLGIFRRSWTLEAADVIMLEKELTIDIEELTERLLDVSLIKPVLVNHTSEPRFNMLQTVHEFANEILEKSSEYKDTKLKYATYFYELCVSAYDHLWGRNAEPWLDKLEYEYQNIRAAFQFFNEEKLFEKSWQFIYLLSPYWTVRGGFSECKDWIEACGMHNDTIINSDSISPLIKGRSLSWAGYCQLFLFDFKHGLTDLNQAETILEKIQDQEGLMWAYLFDGCYGSYLQDPDAEEKIIKGKLLCDKLGNELVLAMYYLWSTEYYRQKGDMAIINENIQKARELSIKNGFIYLQAASYILDFSFGVLNPQNDWELTMQHSQEMYRILPPHGYKGLKAAAKSTEAYSLLMSGRVNEAELPLTQALELGRISGELESNVYNTMEAAHFYWLKGNKEKSYKLLGVFDHFVQTTGYPVVGGGEVQYNKLSVLLEAEKNTPDHKSWYDEGTRMSLNEGIVYALKG